MQQFLRRRAAAAFDDQNGFITRGATGGGDKTPRIAEMLQIEQNGAGLAITGEKIEQVVDVDIKTIAQRNKVREAHFTLLRPVQNGVGDGGGLRDKRQLAALDRHRREAGVEALPRRQEPQAVGAE